MLGGMDFEGEMGEALDRQAATQASIEAMVVKAAEDREAGPRRQGSKTAAAAARWRMAAAAKRQAEAPAKKRAAAVKRKVEAPAKKRAAAPKKTAAPTKRTAARAAKKTAKAAAAEEKGKHCRIRKRTKNSLCVHGRRRYFCKECGGAGICEHGLRRSNCKDCGGHGGGKQRLRSRLQLHWPSVQSEFIECTAEPEPRDFVSTFNHAVLNKKRWARPLGGMSFYNSKLIPGGK